MGSVLRLRLALAVLSEARSARLGPSPQFPQEATQTAVRNGALQLRRGVSRPRCAGDEGPATLNAFAEVSVREPDAGEPHVRFDERRGGNGPWVRLGERGERKQVPRSRRRQSRAEPRLPPTLLFGFARCARRERSCFFALAASCDG